MKHNSSRLAAFLLTPLLGAAPLAAQATHWVDDDTCPSAGDGSAANPFCRVQDAIDAAASGDTIFVHPGTYAEALRFNGKDLRLASLGGPAETRLAGATASMDAILTFDMGETSAAVVEGFTIGGATPQNPRRGVLCVGSSPILRDNVIEHNTPGAPGGGVACLSGATPAILGNHIRENASLPGSGGLSGRGGGIYVDGSAPWIAGNVVQANEALDNPGCQGGGIHLRNSSALIENNLITENLCCDLGGNLGAGLYTLGGAPVLDGNTIAENIACLSWIGYADSGYGGALYAAGDVTVRNSILWNNQGFDGDQIYVQSASNTVSVSFSVLDTSAGNLAGNGVVNLGAGMLNQDPGFVGGNDFHLAPSSPAIDAGVPDQPAGGTDGDVEPRVLDGDRNEVARVDIGWDEYDVTRLAASGTATAGGTLVLSTTAPVGWRYVLAFSRGTGDTSFGPRGSSLLNLSDLFVLGSGTVPGTNSLAIPPMPSLIGSEFFAQALAHAPGSILGSFSRRLGFRIH